MTNIQIAIQGGGAKFIHLLAAAEGFQEMQKKGDLKITQVAGTSAGSIVAAILSSGAEIKVVNRFIRERGANYVNIIRNGSLNVNSNLGRIKFLYDAYRGKPFLKEETLRSFLEDLFNFTMEFVPKTIGDCESINNTKLIITTSDVRDSKSHQFGSKDLFIESIIASCALPLAFRTFLDTEKCRYVDGGLCDNLPAEYLTREEDVYGRVFAISPSFTPEVFPINGVIKYLGVLLSASINHSVRRSKSLVNKSRVVEIETSLGLFDFKKMLDETDLSSIYRENRKKARNTILAYIDLLRYVNDKSEMESGSVINVNKISEAVYRVADLYRGQRTIRVLKHVKTVHANCLLPISYDSPVQPDIVRSQMYMKVTSGNVRFLEVGIKTQGNLYDLTPTVWSFRNLRTGEGIYCELITLVLKQESMKGRSHSKSLLFLKDPIVGSESGDEFVFESTYVVGNGMIGLQTSEGDFIAEHNGCDSKIEEMILTTYLPSNFKRKINVSMKQTDATGKDVQFVDEIQSNLTTTMEVGYIAVSRKVLNVLPGMRVEMWLRAQI